MATTNKTYFQYQGTIKSKEVAEAIGLPCGMGPFMGFARVNTAGDTIYPTLEASDAGSRYSLFKDQFNTPSIIHKVGSVSPSFGLVTRSGHIFVSSNSSLPITLVNTKTNLDELMVFALYQEVEQPIETVPVLLGYYNQSNTSFYDNFYAPIIKGSLGFNLGEELAGENININFEQLYAQVRTALSNDTLLGNITLIGIYGTGTNPNTGTNENFSIVPYQGHWPYKKPWMPSTYSTIKGAIDKISSFLGSSEYNTLIDMVKALLPSDQKDDQGNALVGVPIGTIIMWYGEAIPDGWQLCDGTNGTPNLSGRFPLGAGGEFNFKTEGGEKTVTLNLDNMPAHTHKIAYEDKKWGDNANNRPFPVGSGETGNSWTTGKAGSDNPKPIDIMPPYSVVRFIMRVR